MLAFTWESGHRRAAESRADRGGLMMIDAACQSQLWIHAQGGPIQAHGARLLHAKCVRPDRGGQDEES
jgi:hypothetical protein